MLFQFVIINLTVYYVICEFNLIIVYISVLKAVVILIALKCISIQ